jgi:hypothetical protein
LATLSIVNPVAEAKAETVMAERFAPAPRLNTFAGKTVGLFWNAKSGGEVALARTREQLEALYPEMKFLDYYGAFGTNMRRASDEQLDKMAAECDVVVGTTAD